MENHTLNDIYAYVKRMRTQLIQEAEKDSVSLAKTIITLCKTPKYAHNPTNNGLLAQAVARHVLQEKERLGAWPAEAPLSLRRTIAADDEE